MSTKNTKKKKENSILNSKNMMVFGIAAAVVIVFSIITTLIFPTENSNEFDKVSSNTSALTLQESGLTDVYTEDAIETMSENVDNTSQTPSSAETAETTEQKNEFILPVGGNVTKDYSGDELVYSKTLNDWRTHNGIDFYAEEGTEVLASADGTVEAILENGMFGRTVVLLHANGVRTIYSNLAEGNEVVVGDIIAKGTPLGKVGSSASAEALEEPHLHFEVSLNEEIVNPHDYLPDASSDEN